MERVWGKARLLKPWVREREKRQKEREGLWDDFMIISLKYVVKMMCFDEIFNNFFKQLFWPILDQFGPISACFGPNQTISAWIENQKNKSTTTLHSCIFDSSVLTAQSTHLCFLDYGYRKFFTNKIEFSMFLDLTAYERCHISDKDPKIKILFLSKFQSAWAFRLWLLGNLYEQMGLWNDVNLIVDKTNQQKCLGINEERRKSQLRMIARWSMGKSESWKKKNISQTDILNQRTVG